MKRLLARFGIGRKKKSVFLADRFPQFEIGRGSYGDLRVRSWGEGACLKMGAFCSVAAGVKVFLGGEHRTDWVSTYPFTEFWHDATRGIAGHPQTRGDVVIGHDVWIGTEAMIMSGVHIGDGAVIGARAVVTKDVPPYTIVAGNPARAVRLRFPPEIVERLQRAAWWHWDDERIARFLPLLLSGDVERFLGAAERGDQ